MAQNLQGQLADDVRLPDVPQRRAADILVQQPNNFVKARVIGHCALLDGWAPGIAWAGPVKPGSVPPRRG